jgi:hypothetical protein
MASQLTNDEFIKRSNIVHENFYNYIDVYKRAHSKIKIECPIHGVFEQKAYSHLQGIGCQRCGFDRTSSKIRKSLSDFINESNEVHSNYYGYDKVVYENTYKKVIITCPKHGDFTQRPQGHIKGNGCKKCAPKKEIKTDELFRIQASKIHDDKYEYIEKYRGAHIPISIVCPYHGPFLQSPNSHLKGRGCNDCQWKNSSKMEKEWLDKLNIDKQYRNTFVKINDKLYKFDAYIPEINTIYEFYGDFWHGNPNKFREGINSKNNIRYEDLYKRTIERENFLKENGFTIVSIWEDDYLKQNKKNEYI